MSLHKSLPLLLLLLLLSSCNQKYKIDGVSSVTRLDGKKIFVKVLQNGEWIKIDSAEIVHGLFSMGGKVDSVLMGTIYLGDENLMPLVLEKGTIKISISNTQLSAQGTPLNDALYQFIAKKNLMDTKIEELDRKEATLIMDGVDLANIHKQLAQEGEVLLVEMNNFTKKFIADNYENVLGPSVFMMLCSSLPYPILTPQIEDILKDAPYSFKTNKLIKEFTTKANENKQLIEEHQRMQ